MPDTVTLTEFEMRWVGYAGKSQFDFAKKENLNPGDGSSKYGVDNHEHSCRTEYAASLMLNLFWRPYVGILGNPDVGDCVECRSSPCERGKGHLIIKPKDIGDNLPTMLIESEGNVFFCPGWQMPIMAPQLVALERRPGKDGKPTDEAYWLQQIPKHLRPFSELQQIVNLERSNAR